MCGYLGKISFETIDKDSIINSNKEPSADSDSKELKTTKIENIHRRYDRFHH